jgi:nicotinate-nucleotide adenylyltransferase
MKKVGLFFGTFNPIHNGHLKVANYFVEKVKFEEVWLVVSPQNPFKKIESLIENAQRLAMVNLALKDFPKLKVCDDEINLSKPSYTINTLVHLKNKFPDYDFILILGQDILGYFHEWKSYKDILKNYKIYVYPRGKPHLTLDEFKEHRNIHLFAAPKIEISSTEVRKMILKGEVPVNLIPKMVKDYIVINKLFL